MKTAKRIVSIVYLVSAIVSLVGFIIFLFLVNVLTQALFEIAMNDPSINVSDPEGFKTFLHVYIIVLGIIGSQLSIGEIVVSSINLKTLDQNLTNGQKVTLTAFNGAFGLTPLFVMYLIDTIKHWRDPKVVDVE